MCQFASIAADFDAAQITYAVALLEDITQKMQADDQSNIEAAARSVWSQRSALRSPLDISNESVKAMTSNLMSAIKLQQRLNKSLIFSSQSLGWSGILVQQCQYPSSFTVCETEQWSEINPHVEPVTFHPEESGRILVEVHQVVRDLAGAVLADEHVGHRFTIAQGLIQDMEVCPLS
jgi:hypothetical protein